MAFTAITAKPFKMSLIEDAQKKAFKEVGEKIKREFEKTTATWKKKPVFKIELGSGDNPYVEVGTDNEIFGYVNYGTKPHKIVGPNGLSFGTPSSPKTKPRVIGSSSGSRGSNKVYAKVVQHPGIEPRLFDKVIKKNETDYTVKLIMDAFGKGVEKTGHKI